MSSETRRRSWALLAAWIGLTTLAIVFVDRAASSWSHATLHGLPVFRPLTHLVDPIIPGALIGLAIAGLAAALGDWRPRETGMTVIAACLSVVVAFGMKEQLKYAFGRTWPDTWVDNNPSWIRDGAFGFHPFHGKEGWSSFPSGHMTLTTALAATLWLRVPRLRVPAVILVSLVAIGLLGADYHFVGDMVAGTFLGAACAVGVTALLGGRK